MELTDKAKEEARKYGVHPEQVGAAVEQARGSLRAEATLRAPWGRIYTLYAGRFPTTRFPGGDAPYHVVVLTEYWGEEEVALGVHVVPEGILDVGQRGHPPEMLRALAHHERYGLEVSAWGHSGPFTAPQTIPRARGGEGVRLTETPPPGHEVVLEETAQYREGAVEILLAFAVDAAAVRESLGLG